MKKIIITEKNAPGKLLSEIENFLNATKGTDETPPWETTIENARKSFNGAVINELSEFKKETSLNSVEYIKIKTNSIKIPARIYTPVGNGPFPIILFVHGGGWVMCNLDTHDSFCRKLSRFSSSIVVSIDYSLAPENKYPIALNEIYFLAEWLNLNHSKINGNNRLFVMGDSAGGNLCAALSLMARDRKGPKIDLQVLLYPVTNLKDMNTESYDLFNKGFLLDKEGMEWCSSLYVNNDKDRENSYVSPLLADNFENLPPTYIITAEFDVLRDEAELFAQKLFEAGNDISCVRYNGSVHGTVVYDKIFNHAASSVISDIADVIKGY